MKYLGIDYGLKRVGLAVSDAGGRMAFPLRTLGRETRDAFFAELLTVIEKENIEAIVIGLPLHLDGSESLTAAQARNFAASLGRRCPLPIHLANEYLSSAEASSMLREAGYGLGQMAIKRGNKNKARKELERIDALAAARILEEFLSKRY